MAHESAVCLASGTTRTGESLAGEDLQGNFTISFPKSAFEDSETKGTKRGRLEG